MIQKKTGTNNSIDIIKVVCCILIVGSHCRPLLRNEVAYYYYREWFFRFCVPFFFISSGYFFSKMNVSKKRSYIKRIFLLYAISNVIYFPLVTIDTPKSTVYNLAFGFYHLWYLIALAFGLILVFFADKFLQERKYWLILMLVPGILLDEYYKLFDIVILNKMVSAVRYIGGARNAVFFAMPLLLIGDLIASRENQLLRLRKHTLVIAFLLFYALGFAEATVLLNGIGPDINADVTFFGWMPAVPLFLLGLRSPTRITPENSRRMRKICDVVYIIHIWVVRILGSHGILYLVRFPIATVISFSLAAGFVFIAEYSSHHFTPMRKQ